MIALFFIGSIFACSGDSENFKNLQEENLEDMNASNPLQGRISSSTFDNYEMTLDNLYPNGYTIMEQTTEIKDQGIKYYVTEVHVNSSLKGYFVEVPSANKAVYLDVNGDFVTLYNNSDGKNSVQTYDLTNDPLYAEIGFSPYQSEEDMEGRGFWGWTCGPHYFFPNGDCYQNCVYTIFWIGNGWTSTHAAILHSIKLRSVGNLMFTKWETCRHFF